MSPVGGPPSPSGGSHRGLAVLFLAGWVETMSPFPQNLGCGTGSREEDVFWVKISPRV